jgi:hypothetical protein
MSAWAMYERCRARQQQPIQGTVIHHAVTLQRPNLLLNNGETLHPMLALKEDEFVEP